MVAINPALPLEIVNDMLARDLSGSGAPFLAYHFDTLIMVPFAPVAGTKGLKELV